MEITSETVVMSEVDNQTGDNCSFTTIHENSDITDAEKDTRYGDSGSHEEQLAPEIIGQTSQYNHDNQAVGMEYRNMSGVIYGQGNCADKQVNARMQAGAILSDQTKSDHDGIQALRNRSAESLDSENGNATACSKDSNESYLKRNRFLKRVISDQNKQLTLKDEKLNRVMTCLNRIADKSLAYHAKMTTLKNEWQAIKKGSIHYQNQIKWLKDEVRDNKVAIEELTEVTARLYKQLSDHRLKSQDIPNHITSPSGLTLLAQLNHDPINRHQEKPDKFEIPQIDSCGVVSSIAGNLVKLVVDKDIENDAYEDLIRKRLFDLQSYLSDSAAFKENSYFEKNFCNNDSYAKIELLFNAGINEIRATLRAQESSINGKIDSIRHDLSVCEKAGFNNEAENRSAAKTTEEPETCNILGKNNEIFGNKVVMDQLVSLLQDDKSYLKGIINKNETKLAELQICNQKRLIMEERNRELITNVDILKKSITENGLSSRKLEENHRLQIAQAESKLVELRMDLERTTPYIQKFHDASEKLKRTSERLELVEQENLAVSKENQIYGVKLKFLEGQVSESRKSLILAENKRVNETDALRTMNVRISHDLKIEKQNHQNQRLLNDKFQRIINALPQELKVKCRSKVALNEHASQNSGQLSKRFDKYWEIDKLDPLCTNISSHIENTTDGVLIRGEKNEKDAKNSNVKKSALPLNNVSGSKRKLIENDGSESNEVVHHDFKHTKYG